jgi:hypothetical protein
MSDDKNTSLAIIPRTFDETRALSEYLSNASLVPASARKQPHNAMAMIMAGAEIGLAPMAALRAYHVIEGVPRLTADTMHAVVLKRPDLVAYCHPVEQSPTRVVWKAKRRGEGAVEITATWDLERAKKLPNFGKGPWHTNPQAMLNARAKAEIARLVAPDIVGGLYALEEDDAAAAVEPAPAPNYTAPPAPAASTPAATGTTPSGKANRTRKADAAAAAAPPIDVTPAPAGGVAQAARDHFADSQARVAASGEPRPNSPADVGNRPLEPEIVDAEIIDEQPAAHAAAESTEPDDGFGESPPPAASDAERKAAEYIDKLATLTTKDAVAAWRVEASEWGKTQDVTIFDKLKEAYGADKLKRAAAAAGGAK